MTVHRALRELTAEGWLARVRGNGTFVAEAKSQSPVLEIRNIAEDIRDRGHAYSCDVHMLREQAAGPAAATPLGLQLGQRVFHSMIVHRENGNAVQLEDRYVNPAAAPEYLEQDFTAITPYEYLVRAAPLSEAEHIIRAMLPDNRTQALLEIGPGEPCLLLQRRTWSRGIVVSSDRLIHPGSRYRLIGRFKAPYAHGEAAA
jgi:GntR family histidine utilization transcriptional repressor